MNARSRGRLPCGRMPPVESGRGSIPTRPGGPGLFRLDAGRLHDAAPLLRFTGLELREFIGRGGEDFGAARLVEGGLRAVAHWRDPKQASFVREAHGARAGGVHRRTQVRRARVGNWRRRAPVDGEEIPR